MTEKTEAKTKQKTPGFEKSLERLEKLVAEMESGELDLEKMIGHFEEGQALIKLCTGKLNEVMTPTGPSGCHCSYMRWRGRSDIILGP